MTKNKTKRIYRRYKVKSVRHRRPDEIHLVPDLFYAGAAMVPFMQPGAGSTTSAVDALMQPGTVGEKFTNSVYNLGQSVKSNWVEIAELAVIGVLAKWAGRKVGANKIGTKKVKLA